MERLREPLDYAEILRVIGQFIQQERMSEVSILEYQQGWIVHGVTFRQTAEGFIRIVCDHVLTHDQIRQLRAKNTARSEDSRRRWLR